MNLITLAENFYNNKSRCFSTYASAFFSANDKKQTELRYKREKEGWRLIQEVI